jgi:hypothetical protein
MDPGIAVEFGTQVVPRPTTLFLDTGVQRSAIMAGSGDSDMRWAPNTYISSDTFLEFKLERPGATHGQRKRPMYISWLSARSFPQGNRTFPKLFGSAQVTVS